MKNTHGSRYLLILPDTVKIMFNIDIDATDKTRSAVVYVGRAEEKFANTYIYYTYKDIYLSKKEELLQGIHSASGLKPHAGQEKDR